jgi:curved DNA-binding protein CbpA
MPEQRPRRDHYAVLGVPPSASAGQITSAYRRRVRSLHPDARPADPAAPQDLADVLDAYDTLRDPQRRADYDARRERPAAPAATGQPVPVRVTRRTRTSPARQTPLSRARLRAPGPLDAPEGPLFPASLRIDAQFSVPLGWGDGSFVTRFVQQWLRQTDSWLR